MRREGFCKKKIEKTMNYLIASMLYICGKFRGWFKDKGLVLEELKKKGEFDSNFSCFFFNFFWLLFFCIQLVFLMIERIEKDGSKYSAGKESRKGECWIFFSFFLFVYLLFKNFYSLISLYKAAGRNPVVFVFFYFSYEKQIEFCFS